MADFKVGDLVRYDDEVYLVVENYNYNSMIFPMYQHTYYGGWTYLQSNCDVKKLKQEKPSEIINLGGSASLILTPKGAVIKHNPDRFESVTKKGIISASKAVLFLAGWKVGRISFVEGKWKEDNDIVFDFDREHFDYIIEKRVRCDTTSFHIGCRDFSQIEAISIATRILEYYDYEVTR